MAYTSAEGRQHLLDDIAQAGDDLALALAFLGVAYEQLDDDSADRLEERLFRPTQLAAGRARRTHTQFAERHGLPVRDAGPPPSGGQPHGARDAIERAVEALLDADEVLADLQDSMLPVEVGNAPLRAGLAEVRELIRDLPQRAGDFIRVLGR